MNLYLVSWDEPSIWSGGVRTCVVAADGEGRAEYEAMLWAKENHSDYRETVKCRMIGVADACVAGDGVLCADVKPDPGDSEPF